MRRAVVGIGVPGSGKSTALAPLAERMGAAYVSTDAIREETFGEASAFGTDEDLVWSTAYARMHDGLDSRGTVVVDSTNAHPEYRRRLVAHLRERAEAVHALWFDLPLKVALARNARRDRRVPEHVVETMQEGLRDAPPTTGEGFDSVRRVAGEELAGIAVAVVRMWRSEPPDRPGLGVLLRVDGHDLAAASRLEGESCWHLDSIRDPDGDSLRGDGWRSRHDPAPLKASVGEALDAVAARRDLA